MHSSPIYSLICFVIANAAVLLVGVLVLPSHAEAVWQCYSTLFSFSEFDSRKLVQRLAVLAICLLLEMRILGWPNCSLRKLLWPSRSVQHDLFVGAINLCGFSIVLFLFFTAGLVPVLPSETRRLIGVEWAQSRDHLVLQFLFWFLVRDFLLYWFHRGLHAFAFAWEVHKYHHAATAFTMLTASRTHFVEHALGHACITLPLAMVGMPGEAFLAVTILTDALSRFRHSMVDWKFGWLGSWLLCSPVAHRIHHSEMREHWDRNFGDTLILWDRLFGTSYDGTKINTEVGVSDNYFERQSVIGGLMTSYWKFLNQLIESLRTQEWSLSSRRRRLEVEEKFHSNITDASPVSDPESPQIIVDFSKELQESAF